MADLDFGPIVYKHQVEDAVEATIRKWIESYLGEAGRLTGRRDGGTKSQLQAPVRYARRREIETWAGERLPVVIIHCPGLAGRPREAGGGYYSAGWTVEVGIVVTAKTERDTEEIAGIYAAEIRRLVLQHRSLGDFSEDVSWDDEDYDRIRDDKTRSIAAGVVQFTVSTDFTVRGHHAGPQGEPQPTPRDPYPGGTPVTTVTTVVEPE